MSELALMTLALDRIYASLTHRDDALAEGDLIEHDDEDIEPEPDQEPDEDEDDRPRTRLTRTEFEQGLADRGCDTLEEYECER